MRALILEDNLSYALDYEMILEKLGITVLAVCKKTKPAIDQIKKEIPDFLIVDLLLDNNEKGLDFIEEIRNYAIPFIICTGYPEDEFMKVALEYGAEAFLSKPLDKAALKFEIIKLTKKLKEQESNQRNIIVKYRKSLIKVPQDSIRKIETEGNYSYLFVGCDRKYIMKKSLKKILETLDKKLFKQCHRSSIVNLNWISQINPYDKYITLKNGDKVDLGDKYKSEIKSSFSDVDLAS